MDHYINLFYNDGKSKDEDGDEIEYEITTMVMCGCKNHFIDSRKDPYKEHNKWVEENFERKIEEPMSHLGSVKAIKPKRAQIEQRYDFSGEEFEVTNSELRRYKK